MNNITGFINDYLSKPTEYAILINGKWGQGKTHFYKQTLLPLITDKPVFSNEKKKYKPMYISLFGLKTIEDIATKIVIDFYQSVAFKKYFKPAEKNKALRVTQGIVNIAIRGFFTVKGLSNLNEFKTDIQKLGADTLDTHELVICFDDLERRDSTLGLEDLAGYINTLADEGVKVLLIANEDKLLPLGKPYTDLKEKIIGISLRYIADVPGTITSIIETRYASFPVYTAFLKEQENLLIHFSGQIENNFRNLIYGLDMLHQCYSLIRQNILDTKEQISEKLIEVLPELTKFILAVAVEYKMSNLTSDNIREYANMGLSLEESFILQTGDQKTKETTKYHQFLTKYALEKNQYFCYPSLFFYLTGHSAFNHIAFQREFSRRFNLEKGQTLPQYEILQSLLYYNYVELSDSEFRKRVREVLQFAYKGEYKVAEYLTVIYIATLATRLKLIAFDMDKITSQLQAGLKKAIQKTPPDFQAEFTQFQYTGEGDRLSCHSKSLYDSGMTNIEEERKRRDKKRITEIASQLLSDTASFLTQLRENNEFRLTVDHIDLVNHLNISNLYARINRLDNKTILELKYFFEQRYKDSDHLRTESGQLKELNDKFLQVISKSAKRNLIRRSLMTDFSTLLSKYLNTIANNKNIQS